MSDSTHERLIPTITEAKSLAVEAAEDLLALANADSYDAVVVLGAAWAPVAETVGETETEVDPAQIAGFALPSKNGHAPGIRTAWVGAKRVLVFTGRIHLYDGYGPMAAAHAVRTGITAGARSVILTDAAESLRADFSVGQPILISDHINLTGDSPLHGAEFLDLGTAYSKRMRETARDADRSLAEGVYAAVRGPNCETPAEIRMLRTIGADLVGRSTALESLAAVEMGAEVLGISLVTGEAAGLVGLSPSMAHTQVVGMERANRLGELLNRILLRL